MLSDQLGNVCPECGSSDLLEDTASGEIACQDCGAVVRTRNTVAAHDEATKPAEKHVLVSQSAREIERLDRKWRPQLESSKEKTYRDGERLISRIADKFNLSSNDVKDATALFHSAVDRGIIRKSHSVAGVAAICVHLASSPLHRDYLLKVLDVAGVRRRTGIRCLKLLQDLTGRKIIPTNPVTLIPKIRTKLRLSFKVERYAKSIITDAKKKRLPLGNRLPSAVASAAIYSACKLTGERRSQQSIANGAGVSVDALQDAHRVISNGLGLRR